MAYESNEYDNITCEIDPSLNEVVDESNNNSIVLRRAKWGNNEKSKFKVELRRCYVNAIGEERVGKGCTFITDDGPSKLASALLRHGFGDTKEVIGNIKDREDFNISMRMSLTDEELDEIKNTIIPESSAENLYDPRDILLSEDEYTVEGDD